MSNRLKPAEADVLRDQPLTYDEVGATLETLPAGYHHLDETFPLGEGDAVFTEAADRLMRWGPQRCAGLTVMSSAALERLGAKRRSTHRPWLAARGRRAGPGAASIKRSAAPHGQASGSEAVVGATR